MTFSRETHKTIEPFLIVTFKKNPLHLVLRRRGGMQIFVETLTGIYYLCVEAFDSIDAVKAEIRAPGQ